MAAAYAALVSLMNVIHDLQHHPSPPISLDQQLLHPINQHLIFFHDFIQAYSPPPVANNDEESADPLEMRIANAAYAAEDAIESHIVKSIWLQRSHSTCSEEDEEYADPLEMHMANAAFVYSCIRVPAKESINEKIKSIHLCRDHLQSVIKEMDSIKNLVVDIEDKKKEMVVVHDQVPMKSILASVSRKETIVGLDSSSRKIMEKLTGDESDLQVTPIVGMGGIGKTFLAKIIYEKPLIKGIFDICAWVTISQHIIFFLDFLQAYSPHPVANNDEESVDPLEMRIANAAYAAEDAIESHIVESIQLQRSNSIFSKISRIISCFRVHAKESINENDEKIKSIHPCRDHLQSVIKEMDSIKNLVVDTEDKKKEMVVVHDQVPMKSTIASVSSKETIVGLDFVSREIMEKLIGDESSIQITPIVGMGGIGKTFLVKSIYSEPLIKDHFDICAWATISQQYNTTEILCEIFFQATKQSKEGLSGMSEHELGDDLRKFLFGRRFLIVLDDMWSVDAWDKTRRFFPNNENGSRVLVTTRLSQLSSQLNHNYSLHMSFLDKATSWDLFSKTVFGDERSCPLELKEIGEQIVDNCRGLPLSIVVVGGLLKKIGDRPASWKPIRDNMSSVVNMENDKHCLKLLMMSYNHLPVYLKPCFLYMGVFKEDDRIHVSVLIRLWVSEGFLKQSNVEAMETVARVFLQELVDRNLILIDSLGSTGRIKYFKIHDLLRDLCLKEGQKDGLYHVIRNCNLHPEDMNTLRRVVIPKNTSKRKIRDELRSMSHARSVICEYSNVYSPQNLGFLRTLQISQWSNNMDTLAFRHVNLRHLEINAKAAMSPFLHSIRLLWNLQTLIVSCLPEKITLPSDFWKMPQFRHIEFVNYEMRLPNIPSDERDGEFIIMENLHRLKGVRNFRCCEGMVKRIPNLKILKLRYDDYQPESEYFVENIKSLCRLESLHIYDYSNRYNMQKLSFPQSLKKLGLWMSKEFEWEGMMETIGSLPLLEKLTIFRGCFGKGKWETVEGQFPCLKYLMMWGCNGLENWTAAEEGSILPRLQHLHLRAMGKLKKMPLELGNIDTLKEIELIHCGEEVVKSAKEIVNEQVELQGEGQLCFHVRVTIYKGDECECLKSLAGPHFEVRMG